MNQLQLINKIKSIQEWPLESLIQKQKMLEEWLHHKLDNETIKYYTEKLKCIKTEINNRTKS